MGFDCLRKQFQKNYKVWWSRKDVYQRQLWLAVLSTVSFLFVDYWTSVYSASRKKMSHIIHVWHIYLHLVDLNDTYRQIYRTWMVWVCITGSHYSNFDDLLLSPWRVRFCPLYLQHLKYPYLRIFAKNLNSTL